ncbi:ubiquitin carboxyl-terminal hydrolase domain-containing protein [Trichoderma breve]|uniref:ubiquitinyl hydrolase 1 n=1 Tax=Trichoderma breve TaxID=2034170 RepID=A0A9W9EBW4_9HYPO|nr:ubiquitin carboxyl-terminal hydrolase domain-containing protein [Trichoderma breve]KAJ4863809.1 ubiquitin carboxyl-terminal hydrolase domain-containing protein [Trichoderma breve]
MNSRQRGFDTFYDDQVAARRQFYARETAVNRINDYAVLVTVATLVVTLLAKFCSPDGSIEGIFSLVGGFLWDALVFLIPSPLLFAIDNWMDSSATRPMRDNTNQSTYAAKSKAMRRVMGLDRQDGVMNSVLRARTRALSMTGSVLGLKIESDRPAGLGNRDNSCYQNSVLQGLASLHSMPDYLAACLKGVDETGHAADENVAHTLRMLIADLNDVSNNGKTLWTPSLLKSMNTWTQQDAQEYYSKVLDDIEKGAALVAKNLSSDKLMGLETGEYSNADERSTSEHSDDSGYQSLLAQRVALGLDKNHHDLYERLDSYSKVEAIEGVECPKCTLLKAQRLLTKLVERLESGGSTKEQLGEPLRRLEAVQTALEEDDFEEETIRDRCKIPAQSRVNVTKTKQMVIARPPQSLAIHVNRSVFDPSTFNMIKNSAPVSFPMTLDLGPWCLGSAEPAKPVKEKATDEKEEKDDEEQWHLDPMSSMVAGDLGESRLTGPIYELRAAVTHYGRHENGHYICYRKYPPLRPESVDDAGDDKEADSPEAVDDMPADPNAEETTEKSTSKIDRDASWWRLSDHNVSQVNEEIVMSLAPGVFMLFYECVDPSMILQSEVETGAAAFANTEAQDAAATKQDESKAVNGAAVNPVTTVLLPKTVEEETTPPSEGVADTMKAESKAAPGIALEEGDKTSST